LKTLHLGGLVNVTLKKIIEHDCRCDGGK